MQRFDIHMHTVYCDGNDTAEAMILSAIDKGLETAGISGHSYTPHDTSYCMSREGTEQYIREIRGLSEKYSGSIRVLTGIERDMFADIDNGQFDYVIGSLHYLYHSGEFTDVDDDPYKLRDFADRHFGGDMMCLAGLYYDILGDVVSRTDCDVIGHFDLITKFNERFVTDADGAVIDTRSEEAPEGAKPLFDTSDPVYAAAWKKAADRIFEDTAKQRADHPNRLETLGLLRAGNKPVFEINTGAISRGYRTTPYPAPDQIGYIRSKGGILIMDSDSHSAENICAGFARFGHLADEM